MGVSRNIKITVDSNIEKSYELVEKLLIGFWIMSHSSKVNTFYEDETDNDILPRPIQLKELELLFNQRARMAKVNTISFFVEELGEGIILSIYTLKYDLNTGWKYEINISPGGSHNLRNYDRNTDFSFYLDVILPRLREIGAYPFEITCNDFG